VREGWKAERYYLGEEMMKKLILCILTLPLMAFAIPKLIPDPSTFILLCGGLAGLFFLVYRKRKLPQNVDMPKVEFPAIVNMGSAGTRSSNES